MSTAPGADMEGVHYLPVDHRRGCRVLVPAAFGPIRAALGESSVNGPGAAPSWPMLKTEGPLAFTTHRVEP